MCIWRRGSIRMRSAISAAAAAMTPESSIPWKQATCALASRCMQCPKQDVPRRRRHAPMSGAELGRHAPDLGPNKGRYATIRATGLSVEPYFCCSGFEMMSDRRGLAVWMEMPWPGSLSVSGTGERCCTFASGIATSSASVPGERRRRPDLRPYLLLLAAP